MSSSSYKRGLVTKDQLHETTVTDDELARVCDLYVGRAIPLSGFEIHLLKVLKRESLPISPKEKALVQEYEERRWEFMGNSGHDNFSDLTPDQEAENAEILKEMCGDADDAARSDEDGWIYED